jgi:hypothetical protein
MKIHWIRILVAAFLFEAVLVVLTIPFAALFGMEPLLPYVPAVCFIVGYPFGAWAARKAESGILLHGLLVGIVASIIYFALILAQMGSVQPVVEMYGPVLFYLANALKILGCVAGAYVGGRRRAAVQAGAL